MAIVLDVLVAGVVAGGVAWAGSNRMSWSLILYRNRQDGWCLSLVPLGLMCEHEEERGTTTTFGRRALITWGPWLRTSGPQGGAFGVVSNDVTSVRFEFSDGTTAVAHIYLPPEDMNASFKLFTYTRTNMPPGRVMALDPTGRILATQAFG